MKVVQITAHRSIKHALPSYGSVEAGSGITIDLEEGEDIEKAWNWAWLETQTQIIKQMADTFKNSEWKQKLDLIIKEKEAE